MRPKVVVVILSLTVGLLVIIVLAAKKPQPQSTPLAENATVSVSTTNLVRAVKAPVDDPQPFFYSAPVAVTNDPAEHAKYVRQRIKELNALAMNNDTESRDAILSEVANNPDKKIRAAALEAAIQFDDRSVVPPLQQIAATTEDPEEKQNILDAIDYINLPSLTEYLSNNPAQTGPLSDGTKVPRQTHHMSQSSQPSSVGQ